MIDTALDFICKQMNTYLQLKYNITDGTSLIQLENIAWYESQDTNTKDKSNAFISLVNVEEDRISKSPENYIRTSNGSVTYKNPKVFLNLYLLFSANLPVYEESLKRLSYIIQFFQNQNVFTTATNPSLPAEVDQLICDLYTISFQDLNNLWGVMGSKYLPSVIYKVRLVTINEDFTYAQAGVIKSVTINSKQ
jgi:hypothetical protein